MKIKYLLIAIVLLVYATGIDGYACAKLLKANPPPDEMYQCDDGQYFEITYSKDHKDAYLYDKNHRRIIRMGRVSSKSGEKYSYTHIWANTETQYTFWKNGKKAVIEIGMDKYKNCQIEWERILKDGQSVFICYDRNGKKVDCTKK